MAVVNKVKGFVRNVVGVPPLTLPNAVGDDLLDYKIYGDSKQSGTPAPEAPVEIVSVGDNTINLCPINTIRKQSTSRWSYQNLGKLELVPGKYTVKCHYKQYGTPTKVQISVRDYDELNTAYGYSVYYGLVEDDALVSFTLPTTAKGIQIILYINATADAIDADCEFTNIMLVEGTYTMDTIPEYEPYGYKVPIKVIGKNLFDEQDFFKKACEIETLAGYEPEYLEIDGKVGLRLYGRTCGLGSVADGTRLGIYSGFKENTQYTFSFDFYDITAYTANGDETFGAVIYCYYTDGTADYNLFPASAGKRVKNQWNHKSFTSAANKTILRINFSYATGVAQTYLANIQLEESTTETTYEPYKDLGTTNIYLDEPLRKARDIADYIDFSNKCVVRKLDEMVLDGTEYWRATDKIVYMNWPGSSGINGNPDVYKNGETISTHLKNYATRKDGDLYFEPVNSTLRVIKLNGIYTDVAAWKAFLAEEYAKGNPVTLITPYSDVAIKTEPIELPKIPTAKGTTTVIADTTTQPSNMDVTYYSSI